MGRLSIVSITRLVLVFGALCAGLPAAAQPAPASKGVPAEVLAATEFLLLAYPDLAARPLSIAANHTGRSVALRVVDADATGRRDVAAVEPLLTAEIVWSEAGELVSFAARGVLLDRTRNEAFAEELHKHPTWTDAEAEAALRATGGRAAAPVGQAVADGAKLAKHLGATPTVGDMALKWRPGPNAPFAATPGWVFVAEVTKDRARTGYQFTFEPFGGRLVMVTRQ